MGKKYLDTKKGSIEDAVLNVWNKEVKLDVEEDKKDIKSKENEKQKVLKEIYGEE